MNKAILRVGLVLALALSAGCRRSEPRRTPPAVVSAVEQEGDAAEAEPRSVRDKFPMPGRLPLNSVFLHGGVPAPHPVPQGLPPPGVLR